jgi:hypothetical protein
MATHPWMTLRSVLIVSGVASVFGLSAWAGHSRHSSRHPASSTKPQPLMNDAITSAAAHPKSSFIPTALLVDKKNNTLSVAQYVDGTYKVLKTFHTTLGQV